jgi:hypothetical protein
MHRMVANWFLAMKAATDEGLAPRSEPSLSPSSRKAMDGSSPS